MTICGRASRSGTPTGATSMWTGETLAAAPPEAPPEAPPAVAVPAAAGSGRTPARL
jgi:hypothetical protein